MKTAMQQLKEHINKIGLKQYPLDTLELIIKLEAIEKEQIIEAVNEHDKKCIKSSNNVINFIKPNCKMLFESDGKEGEKYYNETFNK